MEGQAAHYNIVKTWGRDNSFRVQAVVGSYTLVDVKLEKRFEGNLPDLDEPWQIGVIVGSSGSGKTSVAKDQYGENYVSSFEYKAQSVLNDFPEEISSNEVNRLLTDVGFGSPPDWLKPYNSLSQGEKMRVDVARALCLNRPVVAVDEFTSVVDREVAKVCAYAVSKAIHRRNKDALANHVKVAAESGPESKEAKEAARNIRKFVFITCHFDVIDWLECDWVHNMNLASGERTIKKKDPTQQLCSRFAGACLPCGRLFGSITI